MKNKKNGESLELVGLDWRHKEDFDVSCLSDASELSMSRKVAGISWGSSSNFRRQRTRGRTLVCLICVTWF